MMMLRAVSRRVFFDLASQCGHEDFPLVSALWGTALVLAGAGLANFLGTGISGI